MKKIMDAKIKQQFKEIHNLDVDTLEGKVVGFICRKFNSGEKVGFIGKVKSDKLFLSVEHPYTMYTIDNNTCFCAECGVSPDIEDPYAFYIFEGYWLATNEEITKWFACKDNFNADYEKYKEEEKYRNRALHACRTVLDGIIDSKFDMSVDWENIFLGAYNDYGE